MIARFITACIALSWAIVIALGILACACPPSTVRRVTVWTSPMTIVRPCISHAPPLLVPLTGDADLDRARRLDHYAVLRLWVESYAWPSCKESK